MIALLAEPALMNALWKQFQKAIFTKLTRRYAPTAAHAQMFARSRQSTLNKNV
jgi:hypothetical protein